MIFRRLFWKTYPYYFFIIVISLVLTSIIASREMRRMYIDELKDTLEAHARLINMNIRQDLVEHDYTDIDVQCKTFGQITETRVTVIDSDGTVLGDSNENPHVMENHGSRPEIARAFDGEVGVETRYSSTLQTTMMYVAVPVKESGNTIAVVRTALSIAAINSNLKSFYRNVTIGGIIIILLAAIIGSFVFKRFTRPIHELKNGAEKFAQGQLKSKLPITDTEEIATLANTMNKMAQQLDNRIDKIIEQRNEKEAILSSMSEGVITLDNEERIVGFNRAAANFFNLDFETAVGKPIHELARFSDLHDFVSQTFKSADRVEMEITLPGQNERYLQTHGSPLNDASGTRIGVLFVFYDITRIKKLENIRKDFVANVSHELKTPITAITGSAETLLSGASENPDDNNRFLKMIAQNSDRLNNLVEDLLSLARLESETDTPRIHMVGSNIANILKSAVQACQSKSIAKGISVIINCDENLEVNVNSSQLEQAVINLIDNAIKYSKPGKTVDIKVSKIENEILIAVNDQGCGIEKQHLPRLFERFYRIDKARSREAGGTGLGLAIVKHVALVHKGRVNVKSIPGTGSTFEIYLPYNS